MALTRFSLVQPVLTKADKCCEANLKQAKLNFYGKILYSYKIYVDGRIISSVVT